MARLGDRDLTYQLLIKTHKTTVVVASKLSNKIGNIKEDVLSALQQFQDDQEDIPKVSKASDFELCRRNPTTESYDVLDDTERTVKETGIIAWEKLFIRFHDGHGQLQPVQVDIPPTLEPDE